MIEKYLKIVQTMMSFVIVPVIENLLNQLNKNEQQYSHKLVKSQLSFAKEKYEKYYLRLSYLVPCLILLIFLSNYGLLIMLIQYSIGYELLFYCISIILMGIVAYTTRRKVYVKVILDKYSGFSWWIVAVNMVIYLTSYIFMDVRLKIDFTELIVPNSDILATLYSAICLMIAVLVYL
ncbi:hypothetical protein, partial [Aminipila sp.]|uniref:hypothetical protein n=1 Tax=Aminipila sp. TaxID=2060095 RepID=UPI00289D2662